MVNSSKSFKHFPKNSKFDQTKLLTDTQIGVNRNDTKQLHLTMEKTARKLIKTLIPEQI